MSSESAIQVTVGGAGRTSGQQRLSEPATIRAALDTAGGLVSPTPQMSAADIVTVRRRQGQGKVDVFRFSLSEMPAKWQDFALADGDFVVFQWHVAPEKT